VVSTIVWDNRAPRGAADDLLVVPGTVVTVDHSDLGDASGTYNELGGSVSVDPSFLNRRNEHLTASSPLIDAGSCAGAPATDFDGDTRPTGERAVTSGPTSSCPDTLGQPGGCPTMPAERSILLRAPVTRVWRALTDATEFIQTPEGVRRGVR